MVLRVGNGAGFLGDNLDAPRQLVESAEIDYLTLEYLAELTLSILARQREKDPSAGYATDFIEVLDSLCPALRAQPQLRLITNAGGMNPQACAAAAAEQLAAAGLGETPLAVVAGDDLLPRLDQLARQGCALVNLETGETLADFHRRNNAAAPSLVVSANAYLGAPKMAEALAGGARIVVTGRVADASLTVAPAVHHHGWKWNELDRLAGASVAGHLIECGAQVTGGLYRHWENLNLAAVGYPIAEIAADGSTVITKPAGSGGSVSVPTVAEQLVYEIGDPRHYLTPDVDVDFTGVELAEVGADRVCARGAIGRAAPDSYKVSLAYRDGFAASGQLLIFGRDCTAKAQAAADMVLERVARAGYKLDRVLVECLGAGDAVPGLASSAADGMEVVLRIAVQDARRDAVERFTRELAPLVTSGPPGIAGYAAGRGPVRPVFAYWPTLVPKSLVTPTVEVRPARQWSQS